MGGDTKRPFSLITMLYQTESIVCFVSMDTCSTAASLLILVSVFINESISGLFLSMICDVHLRCGNGTLKERSDFQRNTLSFILPTLQRFSALSFIKYLNIDQESTQEIKETKAKVHKNKSNMSGIQICLEYKCLEYQNIYGDYVCSTATNGFHFRLLT